MLHVLKEIRLRVVVVGELHQVSELLPGGEVLHQAGQDGGVLMLHTLRGKEDISEGLFPFGASAFIDSEVETSVLLRSPLRTASRMVCWIRSL